MLDVVVYGGEGPAQEGGSESRDGGVGGVCYGGDVGGGEEAEAALDVWLAVGLAEEVVEELGVVGLVS